MIEFIPANPKQEGFVTSLKKFVLYSGGVASGKSYAGCTKAVVLGFMYPGNRGLICRKENSTIKGSTLKTLLSILPQELIVSYNKSDGRIVHKTRIPGIYSEIQLGGLDKKADGAYPTKIGSTEYGWIFFDECTEGDEGDFKMLATRLRWQIPYLTKEQNDLIPRQWFGATNPDGPHHYLFKFFFEDLANNPELKKSREVFMTTPYENRHNLPIGYIENLEETLSGLLMDRLLHGKWTQAEGVIYKDFDQDNILEPTALMNIKEYKRIIGGGDSNFPLPRACCLIGTRGDGKRELFAEFYKEEATIEDLKMWLENLAIKNKIKITIYHDPSDPQSISKLNKSNHITCLKASNPVVPGISVVGGLISRKDLLISSTCIYTIKELNIYRWAKGKDGERPIKEDDHMMDSLRYALYSETPKKNFAVGRFI